MPALEAEKVALNDICVIIVFKYAILLSSV